MTQPPERLYLLYHELRPSRSNYSYVVETEEFETHVDSSGPTSAILIDQLSEPATVAPPTDVPASRPPPSPVAPPDSEKPAPSSVDAERLGISLGLLGAGAVGLGLGVGFGFLAKADRDDSNAGPCNAADQCSAKGLSLRQDAIREALVSTIGFSAGAAALGACAIVTFAIPHRSTTTAFFLTPVPMAGGAGAAIRTSF